MTDEEFKKKLKELKIELTKEAQDKLNKFYKMLVEKNKVMNLTAITAKEEVNLKHFYDSLTLVKVIDLNKELTLCDVGTGAGFPGIVLKIVFPQLKIVLIDSLNKRIEFLNEVIEKLDLKDIKAVHDRVEVYSKNNIEKFDIVTSRAVAKTNILLEMSSQLVKVDGKIILLKAECKEEIKKSLNAIKELNLSLEKEEEFTLPIENSKRTIVVFNKKRATNKKYPREFAKIRKRPL